MQVKLSSSISANRKLIKINCPFNLLTWYKNTSDYQTHDFQSHPMKSFFYVIKYRTFQTGFPGCFSWLAPPFWSPALAWSVWCPTPCPLRKNIFFPIQKTSCGSQIITVYTHFKITKKATLPEIEIKINFIFNLLSICNIFCGIRTQQGAFLRQSHNLDWSWSAVLWTGSGTFRLSGSGTASSSGSSGS